MKIFISKPLGASLLVAGTQIGAGMLALPIATAAAGFWMTCGLFLVAFLFMLLSLFLLLEVNLWSHKISANIITMAKEHLGVVGLVVAWISFLLLLYSVAAAYISGGGSLLAEALNAGLKTKVTPQHGIICFLIIFGFFVVFGTRAVDSVNRILMVGLIAAFAFLLTFTTPHIEVSRFEGGHPVYLWAAAPVVILSFTSHIIVPSLRTYLAGDLSHLKYALFWGSVIPLAFYLLWECIIVGALPSTGAMSLQAIASLDYPIAGITEALGKLYRIPAITLVVGFFSFFALVTSFFGVSLSLFDFLADGFNIRKNVLGKIALVLLMYLPPLFFVLFYPSGFLLAVGYAGVFVAILYGILPSIMIWKGRYIEKQEGPFRLFGGKIIPILIFLGSVVVIVLQVMATNHWLPQP